MQHITILCPSPLQKDAAIRDLVAEYGKRIHAPIDFQDMTIKARPNDTDTLIKQRQGEALLNAIGKLPSSTAVIALDERGTMLDSVALSAKLDQLALGGFSRLCFVIGGAFGLQEDVLKRAHITLSLGKMVWPHRLVAVMLLEQIYRAQQIAAGHPYHKD